MTDVSETAGSAVPARVRAAVRLLWISMALAVPASVFSVMRAPEGTDPWASIVVYGLLFALNAWINLMVYLGRNWARILTFAFLLLGAYYTLDPADEMMAPGVVEWAIDLVCLVLEGVAVYWLYTQPGAAWFARRR